jgi:hypothetical protein
MANITKSSARGIPGDCSPKASYDRPTLRFLGQVRELTTSSSNHKHDENTGADTVNNANRNYVPRPKQQHDQELLFARGGL